MILYHGTNEDIKAIDLSRGLRHKDFGKGFYLTPDRTTALFSNSQTSARVYTPQSKPQHCFRTDTLISNIISERSKPCTFSIKQA